MKTVLIVEDDPSNLQVFCSVFSAHHFDVVEAATGREAVQASRRHGSAIDVAVCDLELPDISGTQVAVEVQRLHPETGILFISGTPFENWPDADIRNARLLTPGSADFLEKPFRPSDLQSKIDSCLDRRSNRGVPVSPS